MADSHYTLLWWFQDRADPGVPFEKASDLGMSESHMRQLLFTASKLFSFTLSWTSRKIWRRFLFWRRAKGSEKVYIISGLLQWFCAFSCLLFAVRYISTTCHEVAEVFWHSTEFLATLIYHPIVTHCLLQTNVLQHLRTNPLLTWQRCSCSPIGSVCSSLDAESVGRVLKRIRKLIK